MHQESEDGTRLLFSAKKFLERTERLTYSFSSDCDSPVRNNLEIHPLYNASLPKDGVMKTRDDILNLLAAKKPEFEKIFKIKKLALFGSYARGDQRTDSDVDILVEVDPSIGLEFVVLAESIEKLLGLPVDIVSQKAMKPRALQFIQQELIYV